MNHVLSTAGSDRESLMIDDLGDAGNVKPLSVKVAVVRQDIFGLRAFRFEILNPSEGARDV